MQTVRRAEEARCCLLFAEWHEKVEQNLCRHIDAGAGWSLVHFVCVSSSHGLPATFKPLHNSLFLGVRLSTELVEILTLIRDHEVFVRIHVHKQKNKQDTKLKTSEE